MYRIAKQFQFSASHQLFLPYDSPCNRLHGHNYRVDLLIRSLILNDQSMVIDYNNMKPFQEYIDRILDHKHLNDIFQYDTTAENIAIHLYRVAKSLWSDLGISVRVSETEKTWAEYYE